MGCGINKGAQGLGIFRAISHFGDIDIFIAHGEHGQVFFRGRFACGEFSYCSARRGFGKFACWYWNTLSVDMKIFTLRPEASNMVQTAIANVIGPTIATNNPYAAHHQLLGHG